MTDRISRVFAGQRKVSAGRENRLADMVENLADNQSLIAGAVVTNARNAVREAFKAGELFILTSVTGTELVGTPGIVTPAGGATTATIHLPDDLTATAWPDSVTVTHTDVNTASASNGADPDEDWIMTKKYAVGDVIEAFIHDDGRWMDRNIAGRMWMAVEP